MFNKKIFYTSNSAAPMNVVSPKASAQAALALRAAELSNVTLTKTGWIILYNSSVSGP
jgi:hypothetical protein